MFRPLTQSLHRLSLVLPSTVACQAVPETNAMTKTQLWFCLSNQTKLNCLRETSVLPRDKSHVIAAGSGEHYHILNSALFCQCTSLPFFILCCLIESPSNNWLTYTKQNKYRYFVWGLTVLTVIQGHVNSRYGVLLRCLTLEALEALSSLRNAYLYTECVAQVEQGCFAQRDNSHWCLDSISALYIYKFVAELLIWLGLWKWD